MVSSSLKLHVMATGRQSLVVTALTMLKQYLFEHQGHVSAALILGGMDRTGPSLYTVYPHGRYQPACWRVSRFELTLDAADTNAAAAADT